MRRVDLALCGLALGTALLSGCGDSAPGSRSEDSRDRVIQADPTPVPDFHEYMLGDLPRPGGVGRDPFLDPRAPEPPATAPAAPAAPAPTPAPSLRGIVRSGGRFVALFDRGSASQGESVQGWHVRAIDEHSVTLERGARTVRREL